MRVYRGLRMGVPVCGLVLVLLVYVYNSSTYIMYIYVPNGIRNSYAKRDRNWSRTYHSLPYAQTDNYDPIKTRRYETGKRSENVGKISNFG